MSQLTFAAIPGFFDLADSALAGGQPLTDDSLIKINQNAKFAAVRTELLFMGFFQPGDTVPTPVSPVDGYIYSRNECLFLPILVSSRSPAAGFVSGQEAFPALSSVDAGTGNLIVVPYQLDIDDSTGVLTCKTYWSGSGAEDEGTVKIYCAGIRSSINVAD